VTKVFDATTINNKNDYMKFWAVTVRNRNTVIIETFVYVSRSSVPAPLVNYLVSLIPRICLPAERREKVYG
jgi:hypothetical protein